jgi:flagellar FliJ protein
MAQKFALRRLLEIAETTAESAAASLGALNRQLQQQEEKLLLLFKYRDEYQERLRNAAGTGLDGASLRNFQDFLERLEQAILQQHALVVDTRTRVECGRTDWQSKQKKSMAFGTLAGRFDTATRRVAAGREQKLQDDFASRTHRARQHGLAPAASAKNRR